MGTIASAFASLKAMKDLAQAMIGLRDAAAFQEKRLEFQARLIDAQDSIAAIQEERSTLVERIGALEKELADLKAWEAEKQRYELKAVDTGAFAYSVKPAAQAGEPPHWICAACYQRGQKSILQDVGADKNNVRRRLWTCPNCKSAVHVAYTIQPS